MKIYWAPRRPLSTAIIHFRDKRLILQVDNARSYSDIVLPSALFCSTKRHCLTEAYICAVTVTLRKNHSSSLRLPPPSSTKQKYERGHGKRLRAIENAWKDMSKGASTRIELAVFSSPGIMYTPILNFVIICSEKIRGKEFD